MKRYLWAGLLLVLLAGCQRPLPAIPAMPPAVATLRVAADFTPTEEMVWQRLMAQLAAETKLPLYVEMVPPGTEDADLAVEASLPEEALLQGTFTLLPLDDDPYLLLYRGRVEAALPSTWEEVTGLSRRLSALPGWDPQLLPAIALSPQAPDVLLALAFQGEGDLPLALATLKKWVVAGDVVLRLHPKEDLGEGRVLLAFLPFSQGSVVPDGKAKAFPGVPHRYRYLLPLRPVGPQDPLGHLLDFFRDPSVQAYWAWQVGTLPPDGRAFATDLWQEYEAAHPVAAAGRKAAAEALAMNPAQEALLLEEAKGLLSTLEPALPRERR